MKKKLNPGMFAAGIFANTLDLHVPCFTEVKDGSIVYSEGAGGADLD